MNYRFEVLECLANFVPGLRSFSGVEHVEFLENRGRESGFVLGEWGSVVVEVLQPWLFDGVYIKYCEAGRRWVINGCGCLDTLGRGTPHFVLLLMPMLCHSKDRVTPTHNTYIQNTYS